MRIRKFAVRVGPHAVDRREAAIRAYLDLLEGDLCGGRKVRRLPDELVRAMLANLSHAEDFDEDIVGEVAL